MFRSLVPWREGSLSPTSERLPRVMGRLEEEMGDFIDRFWGGDGGWLTRRSGFLPTADIVETENQFEVTVDLPGLKPEEVNVELKDGELWISGRHEEEKEEKSKTYHRIERHHGEFCRVLPLPTAITEEKVEAKFEDGLLKIVVPKSEESKARHIEVKG